MKKYSTSEAIAMLEKNPKLVFEDEVRVCGDIGTGKRVRMWVNSCHEIKIDGVSVGVRYGLNTNDEWELIQQPIPFMEAVKAYSEGKTIRCERRNMSFKFDPRGNISKLNIFETDNGAILSCIDVIEGTWYVEDSNE